MNFGELSITFSNNERLSTLLKWWYGLTKDFYEVKCTPLRAEWERERVGKYLWDRNDCDDPSNVVLLTQPFLQGFQVDTMNVDDDDDDDDDNVENCFKFCVQVDTRK